jgi:hypothetical protein
VFRVHGLDVFRAANGTLCWRGWIDGAWHPLDTIIRKWEQEPPERRTEVAREHLEAWREVMGCYPHVLRGGL